MTTWHHREAELALLGLLLADPRLVDRRDVADGLVADPIVATAWQQLAAVARRGVALDAVSAVQVLADGAAHPDCVVTSGAITLQRAASVAQIGLACPATVQTTRIEAGAADGTAQGKTKRINKCVLRFHNTLGAFAGPDDSNLDEINFRTGSDLMDQAPPLFSGDKLMEWPGSYDFDGYVMVRQEQPLPMTLVAVMPQLHTFDR